MAAEDFGSRPKWMVILGGFVGCGVLVGCGLLFLLVLFWSQRTTAINNKYNFSNKQKASELVMDKMTKILCQQAGISTEYKGQFVESTQAIMAGRKDAPQLLFKAIHEHNPTFDSSLLKTLMHSVEAYRGEFTEAQMAVKEAETVNNKYIETNFWVAWFPGVEKVEAKFVTSTGTEQAFKTGKEDDIDLFKKQKEVEASK